MSLHQKGTLCVLTYTAELNTYYIQRLMIAPLSDIQMFYIKYLTMHKVHMHTGSIRQLLYGLCVRTGDNPLDKGRELSSRTYAQTKK